MEDKSNYSNILSFKNKNHSVLLEKDDSQKYIGYSELKNCIITGINNYYPNVLLYSIASSELISPYDEKIMSLNKESFYDNNQFDFVLDRNINYHFIDSPVFFFIYNFDNYYHFLYDTIPYLYTYLELKKKIPLLKCLLYYPNKNKKEFYPFNKEILEKIIGNLGGNGDSFIIHHENNAYVKMYVSTSLTHNGSSNEKPRNEIFDLYHTMKKNINYENINSKYMNKRNIYISRRTWMHNDYSNIGTNYTTRRKMMNEDNLVEKLKEYDFYEVFAEHLNMDEKIYLFSNAEKVCGSIGGGMCNLLFSNSECKSFIIVSPEFLKINSRFKYSMDHTNITYYFGCQTYIEKDDYPTEHKKIPNFTRIKIVDKDHFFYEKCGEIIDCVNWNYSVHISNNDVAGFNNEMVFEKIEVLAEQFVTLDNGLNSPFTIDVDNFIELL